MSDDDTNRDDQIDWIYRESTKRGLMIGLYIACALTFVAELFVLGRDTHGEKSPDWGFGFYGVLGFVSCTAMIFIAKGLSFLLKKPTDFYDEKPASDKEDTK